MEGNMEEYKNHVDNLVNSLKGITGIAESAIKKSLEELKKEDPKKAEEQARVYAEALNNSNIEKGFSDLKKQFESISNDFKNY
jgi:hypothetical protein